MDNKEQLDDLLSRLDELPKTLGNSPATSGTMSVLIQVVADLAMIVRSHIYENDDHGQP